MSAYAPDIIRSATTMARTKYKNAPSISSLVEDAKRLDDRFRKTAEYYHWLLRQREKELAMEQDIAEKIMSKANEAQSQYHWTKEDIIEFYRKIAGSALGVKKDRGRIKLGIEVMDALSEGDSFICTRARSILDYHAEWMESAETTMDSNAPSPWLIYYQKTDPIIKDIEYYMRSEL